MDAFWSRGPSTVAQNRYRVRRIIKDLNDELGISQAPFYDFGPHPLIDDQGYKVAFATLLASTKPGRYDKSHTQWQTIRHIKGAVGTYERTSAIGPALVDDDKARVQHFQEGGTSSLWYQLFSMGCKSRMGSKVIKNLALDVELILEVLSLIDQKIEDELDHEDSTERDKWVIAGAYLAFSYVLSLRGNECFMMDIKQLLENPLMEKGLVWIVLSGVMKGQTVPTLHQLRSVPITGSGVDIRLWKERLMVVHQLAGRQEGPAICDSRGFILNNQDMNELFWSILEEVYSEKPELFPKDISSKVDIRSSINIYRTLRRSSNSQAISMGVKKEDIDIVERWRNVQVSQGKAPGEAMHIGYAEQELLNRCFERYTSSM